MVPTITITVPISVCTKEDNNKDDKMAGNSFGQIFKITTFGESHGEGVGVTVDGCPPHVRLSSGDFVRDMARRRPGKFQTNRNVAGWLRKIGVTFLV